MSLFLYQCCEYCYSREILTIINDYTTKFNAFKFKCITNAVFSCLVTCDCLLKSFFYCKICVSIMLLKFICTIFSFCKAALHFHSITKQSGLQCITERIRENVKNKLLTRKHRAEDTSRSTKLSSHIIFSSSGV